MSRQKGNAVTSCKEVPDFKGTIRNPKDFALKSALEYDEAFTLDLLVSKVKQVDLEQFLIKNDVLYVLDHDRSTNSATMFLINIQGIEGMMQISGKIFSVVNH